MGSGHKHTVEAIATDAVGLSTTKTQTIELTADTTPPNIALSGSMTEQATLGTAKSQYTLKLAATDGTEAAPQSGVASTEIKLDGTKVDSTAPGCPTENCAITREWTLKSPSYTAGKHTVEAIATDAVGKSSTKTLSIELTPDTGAPEVGLSGSMTEEATLGTSRPRYTLKMSAADGTEGGEGASGKPTYASSFGSTGSGNGQLYVPVGIAADPKTGNLWVADHANARVEEFSPGGEFIRAVSTKFEGQGAPYGVTVDPEGHVWAVNGSGRIQEFTSTGELIRGFGKSGWGAGVKGGEFNVAEGIALDSKGNVYVTDRGNHRIQEFTGTGEYIRSLSRPKEAEDPNMGAMDVSIDSSGNIWATYGLEGKVAEFNPTTGAVIREWGTEGTGAGQIKYAYRLAVGPEGNIWLSEYGNNRVQVFTPAGEYLYGFGAKGTGAGQFDGARGVAFSGSKVYVVDSGVQVSGGTESVVDSRIEKWAMPTSQSGLTSTEITIDGTKVDSSTGCEAEGCSLTREWTLNSGSYSPGSHTVVAKAKDGAGHTTTKTVALEVQRDTTAPQLAASGSLVEAPEGWVEQEGYAVTGSAPDAGYGTTQLKLMIDGKEVASSSQSCPDGGCSLSHTFSVNTAAYSGGAHPAELVATDGAGNTARHKWTMNVDPEGHVSAAEAEDTLEASDLTSETNVVAPTSEFVSEAERADGNDPSLSQGKEGLESSGTPDLSVISPNPAGGFAVKLPEGTVQAEPVKVNSGSTSMAIAEGVSAVAGNTSANTDSIVRPIFDGVMTYQSIRDKSAPEEYSWEVALSEGQVLKSVDSQDAEIDFADGTEAMLITAESSHDAVGATVPTSLSISEGNIITLTIPHRAHPYVYPVVAGAGWEGGYTTEAVAPPMDKMEIEEEKSRVEREEAESEELARREQHEKEDREFAEGKGPAYGPEDEPETMYGPKMRANAVISTVSAPEMVDLITHTHRRRAVAHYCSDWYWDPCSIWSTEVLGSWYFDGEQGVVGGAAWRGDTTLHCEVSSNPVVYNESFAVGWAGANPAPYGYGEYVDEWCNFEVAFLSPEDTSQDLHRQIQNHLFGDGYQKQHIHHYGPLEA
jgi:sugar lactone lactonase YvrE